MEKFQTIDKQLSENYSDSCLSIVCEIIKNHYVMGVSFFNIDVNFKRFLRGIIETMKF